MGVNKVFRKRKDILLCIQVAFVGDSKRRGFGINIEIQRVKGAAKKHPEVLANNPTHCGQTYHV